MANGRDAFSERADTSRSSSDSRPTRFRSRSRTLADAMAMAILFVVPALAISPSFAMEPSAVGTLRIVCSTPDARVFIDGEEKGAVNSTINGVAVGRHIVEVRARGFVPQSVEITVAAAQLQVARVDVTPQPPATGRLRVVASVPNTEVFIDGASVGPAPYDHSDLPPGKHYIIVRAHGFGDWKREIDLDPASPALLEAELSASGTVKVLSSVSGATVVVDGEVLGTTPVVLDVAAGEHLLEVKLAGYVDSKQQFRIDGGEQKILSIDLSRSKLSAAAKTKRVRSMASFSAVTVDPKRFTADLAGGYVPFGQLRLTAGVVRTDWIGFDVGVEMRTVGYLNEGLAHAKLQFLQAGPLAIAFDLSVGGGGGPVGRNDFIFEAGIPFTLLFGNLVRFTAHPYMQLYSDQNCPTRDALASDPTLADHEQSTCSATQDASGKWIATWHGNMYPLSQDPRMRFLGARLMLQAALEIAVAKHVNIFAIFEGDPLGRREALTAKFSKLFPTTDVQMYGRLGITFKF
jgi:PEGA domain-containing protein